MISISISCEPGEIDVAKDLLAGFAHNPVVDVKKPDFIEERTVYLPPREGMKNSPRLVTMSEPAIHTEQPKKKNVDFLKIGQEHAANIDARKQEKAKIRELYEAGKTVAEIQGILGLKDARSVSAVTNWIDRKKKEDMKDPASEIKDLRDAGANSSDARAALDIQDKRAVRSIYRAESKREQEAADQRLKQTFRPIEQSPTIIKRIIQLDDEKFTPKSISDIIEEEDGRIITEAEIMDIVTRNSKGLI